MPKQQPDQQTIERFYAQAKQSFFDIVESLSHGALATDSDNRIVWIDDQYLKFLGIADRSRVLGKAIDRVIPNSLLPQVVASGMAVPLDIMEFSQGWAVVSRFPLRDTQNRIIGAFGFILFDELAQLKPLADKVQQLQTQLSKTRTALERERHSKYSFAQFVGNSDAMLRIKRQARLAANNNATVLLTGPTGTGKEMLAQAIHAASARAGQNFVAINAAAIPESLLEAELFGAAPGAYTGQGKQRRIGKLELAGGGTLFLDELGDIPLSTQVKLLRVIQERELEAIGSNELRKVDLRIIAATSQNIPALIEQGKFRADLYYRLNVISIAIPPLAEHPEDIQALAESLLETIARENRIPQRDISPRALELFSRHDWPGNIRELRNVLERACMLSGNSLLDVEDFQEFLPAQLKPSFPATPAATSLNLPAAVAGLERRLIQTALAECRGNKLLAAKRLGISRSNLYLKMQRYQLH